MTLARYNGFVIFVASWWKIAGPRPVAACPMGFSRTGKVSLVTSAILHHEVTLRPRPRPHGCKWRISAVFGDIRVYLHGRHEDHEGTMVRPRDGWHGLRTDGNRPLPTDAAISALNCSVPRRFHPGSFPPPTVDPVYRGTSIVCSSVTS